MDQAEYNDSIRTLAEQVLQQQAEGRARVDAVHEQVNSSRMVFNTPQAKEVMQYYHNEPNSLFSIDSDDSVRDVLSKLAFHCVEADVYAVLQQCDRAGPGRTADWGAGVVETPDESWPEASYNGKP